MLLEPTSPGFLDASRAQSVSRIIGKTERLVANLGLAPSDLECAEEALRIAKALYAVRDFSEAVAQAHRAGALAVSLNDRFNAYVSAWRALQKHMAELEELGFPTDDLEAALGEAEAAMAHLVEEDGAVVPDYLGATARLERAAGEARAALVGARQGSREIFLATLAAEALSKSDSSEAVSLIVGRLERLIEQATSELARGHIAAAAKLASEARRQADEVLIGSARMHEFAEDVDNFLEELGAETPMGDAPGERMDSVRAPHEEAPEPAPSADVLLNFSDEAVSFMDRFAKAQRALERAERVRAFLKDEGFSSPEVDEALVTARRAADAGNWADVRENLGRATRVFVDRKNERAVLTRGMADLDDRLVLLQEFGLPLFPKVRESLDRAREALRSGKLPEAADQLVSANVLMAEATRTGS